MTSSMRHAYGWTLIGVAALIYAYSVWLSFAMRSRLMEHYPEVAKDLRQQWWKRWNVMLPDDPTIKRGLRLTHILNLLAAVCLIAGGILSDNNWRLF